MKVEIGKDYRTVDGQSVRIICVDRKTSHGRPEPSAAAVGLVIDELEGDESVDFWCLNGQHPTLPGLCLTEASDLLLKSLKMDDPVEVKLDSGKWGVRHFAGQTLNGILVWTGGLTSKTVPACLYKNTATRGAVERTEFRAYRARA